MREKRQTLKMVGNKRFHMNMLATILGLVAVTGILILITSLGVYIPSKSIYVLTNEGNPAVHELISNAGTALVIFMLMALIMIYFYSKRITGPVYRLEQTFKSLMRKDLKGVVHFRKGDEFTDLAVSLNHFLNQEKQSQQKRAKLIGDLIRDHQSIIKKWKQKGSSQLAKEALHRLKKMEQGLQGLKKLFSE